jgi:hypothetical protein
MIRNTIIFALAAALMPATAMAAPGVGEKVYGATVKVGVTEFEARYGRLNGGADNGEDGLVLEVAHGFSKHFYGAILAEFERPAGGPRKLAAIAVEAIVPLGRIEALQLDTAIYGEFAAVKNGHNAAEMKALFQHRAGSFDSRLNLKFVKELGTHNPIELAYEASVDWAAVGELRLGAAAFGDLGSTRNFAPRASHFAGPIAKYEIEGLPGNSDLDIETGYLFPIGAAKNSTKGQFRLLLEWEGKF